MFYSQYQTIDCWCCSSALTFVRLYRLLLKHCIMYQWQTNILCRWWLVEYWFHLFLGGDRNICSMALPSVISAVLDGQSIVGSVCDSKKCRSLDLVLTGLPLIACQVKTSSHCVYVSHTHWRNEWLGIGKYPWHKVHFKQAVFLSSFRSGRLYIFLFY